VSQPRLPAIQPDVDIRQIEPIRQLARRTADLDQTPQARHGYDGEEHIIYREDSCGAPDVKPRKTGAEIASSAVDFSARLSQYPCDQEAAEHEEYPNACRPVSIADWRRSLVTDEYEQERQSPKAIKAADARAFYRIQNCTSQQVEPNSGQGDVIAALTVLAENACRVAFQETA
jgi:hypothetical protein